MPLAGCDTVWQSHSLGAAMLETTTIEFLILANHVEAANGLLYISGGGWTEHYRRLPKGGAPTPSHFGVGLSVLIPWHETNQPHHLAVQVENEDATNVVAKVDADIKVGRPPNLPPGTAQHAIVSLSVDTIFPAPGGYRVVARLDDDKDVKTWPFRVHDVVAPT